MSTLIKTYGVDHGTAGARDASGTGRDLRDSVDTVVRVEARAGARERNVDTAGSYGLLQALAVATLVSAAAGYIGYLAIAGWRLVLYI